MVLERFYSSEEERNSRTLSCNFFGHLEKESTACLAVTGCPGSDNLEMTINSKHSGPSNKYVLHKDGFLEMVESAFSDPRVRAGSLRVDRGEDEGNFHNEGDEMIDSEEIEEIMEIEELCASGDCSSIPATNLMKIKVL